MKRLKQNSSTDMVSRELSIFSQLPIDVLHLILRFDGKIILPRMDVAHQSNIINYLKNANKSVNILVGCNLQIPLLDLPRYGSLHYYVIPSNTAINRNSDVIFVKTYNYREEEDIENEQYLSLHGSLLRPLYVERLDGENDFDKFKIRRCIDIIDKKIPPRVQKYPDNHESILHVKKRQETFHFQHDRSRFLTTPPINDVFFNVQF